MTAAYGDQRLPEELRTRVGALWGKSDACGQVNLLLQHLLDTGAVAEQLWDHYLAPGVRQRWDHLCGGRGRAFLTWLCAAHDVGKATPAFQSQVPDLALAVEASGLPIGRLAPRAARQWRHDRAGGKIMRDAVLQADWSKASADWLWPLIAGHHGAFPPRKVLAPNAVRRSWHGDDRWGAVQRALVDVLTATTGFDGLADVEPRLQPARADQLALSGIVVMADWIASDERHFPGISAIDDVTWQKARHRAARAWSALGLRGGWGQLADPKGDVTRSRFGLPARPSQQLVVDMARTMSAPGLILIEAPMGEGKTEAALAAVEVLAARFGADGLFVGMPTQATSDPMYRRVREWSSGFAPDLQIALLHGKRMFNEDWQSLVDALPRADSRPDEDEFGCKVDYGLPHKGIDEDGDDLRAARTAPAEWFLGQKRGLLAPAVVGTIDQLLYSATRTRHVMLRSAGLAGKVVVLDEIHAADTYMLQFVDEALRWLGQGQVPVVLLSATLAPRQRQQLVASYVQGALGDGRVSEREDLPTPAGYPSVTLAWVEDEVARYETRSCPGWRPSQHVVVEILEESVGEHVESVASLVFREVQAGGCALVIRNTVARANETYAALRRALGDSVFLLHARLSVGARADRTEHVLSMLGPPDASSPRPERLVVVATQLAEQSFDVDVDLLVTDLAPIDLLLQRIGRLHRHTRPATDRPPRLRQPKVVVTGFGLRGEAPPWFPGGALAIYGEYHLLRTAALVAKAAGQGGWSVPGDIPGLVAAVYGNAELVPEGWRDRELDASRTLRGREELRVANAQAYLLVRKDEWSKRTLEGLHYGGALGVAADDEMRAVVRDGPETVEVVLVRRDERGYRTLDKVGLGAKAENGADLVRQVLAGTVRLPSELTQAAKELGTLPEWSDRAWLRFAHVLVLDVDGRGHLGEYIVEYDAERGLLHERAATGARPDPARAGTT